MIKSNLWNYIFLPLLEAQESTSPPWGGGTHGRRNRHDSRIRNLIDHTLVTSMKQRDKTGNGPGLWNPKTQHDLLHSVWPHLIKYHRQNNQMETKYSNTWTYEKCILTQTTTLYSVLPKGLLWCKMHLVQL